MTVGNGVISGMNKGIQDHIVNGFLGDIVIVSDKQKSDNILFPIAGATIEPISNFKEIKKVLENQESIDRFIPVGKNLAMTLSDDGNAPGFAYLIGVNFDAYQKMFPDKMTLIEGRFMKSGERGVLVPVNARKEYFNYTNHWISPKKEQFKKSDLPEEDQNLFEDVIVDTSIVLMGMNDSNSPTDVRFPVRGIVKFRSLNTIFGHFTIADIDSYRECLGYLSGDAVDIPKEEQKLLSMESDDLDALFSSDNMLVSNSSQRVRRPLSLSDKKSKKSEPTSLEDGTYNVVFVKLRGQNHNAKQALKKLNMALSDGKSGVHAVTWRVAAGPVGSMTMIIKGALFIFVTLLFVVAIIIIVNTLVMAALERTSEIGMMRAIGAKKGFIGGMFLGETAILSASFGGAGILAGIIGVNVIPLLKISTANDMVQLLYGGDIFNPLLTVPDIGITVLQLCIVTILAALYPMKVARSITPLDAVTRD